MIEKVVNHITENIANSVEKKLEVNNNMKKKVREAEKSPTGIKTEETKIDLQQLKPIERLILAFMGDMKWEIKQLETQLTVEKSCSSIGKGQLTNFLKNRPHLFAITDIYVHSYLNEKEIVGLKRQFHQRINNDQNAALKEKKFEVNNNMKKTTREAEKIMKTEGIKIDLKQLKPIERDILAFMGDMKWEIKLLETQLTVEKSCPSIGKGQLTNFLKNRPHLFVITEIYVQSHLKEEEIVGLKRKFDQSINRAILKTVRKNPEADCNHLFKLLTKKCHLKIHSAQELVKFLSERNLLPNEGRIIQEQNNLVPKLIESCENFRNTSPIDVIGIAESILEI